MPTRRSADVVGRPVDVAYRCVAGPHPGLFMVLPVPLVLLWVVAPASLLGAAALLVGMLALAVGQVARPKRVLAVAGSDVWLLDANRWTGSPTKVLATTTREELLPAEGSPFPCLSVDGHRAWFLFGATAAARQLPLPPGDGA